MEARIELDPKGLVLAPGELSRAPGAVTVADNLNVEVPGVIRSRQGFARQTNGFGGPAWKFVSTKELGSNLLLNYGTTTAAANLRLGDGATATSAIAGTYTNQPATRMQVAVGHRNHYLTTDEGVRRIESDMSPWAAGLPDALPCDLSSVTVLSGAPGFVIADTESVAYRVTFSKNDQQAIPMEGRPSSRTVVYNNTRTSGYAGGVTKNVTLRILLPSLPLTAVAQAPSNLTTAFYVRLYRSQSAATGITPSDDMNVVFQAYLTAGQITAGYLDVTDSTPEAFRALGDPLYTNASLGGDSGVGGPGLIQANAAPPRARDVALYAECMFYSDIVYRSSVEFILLSTVAGTGLTAADTLTIGGIVYTAIAPGAPANNEFQVFTVAGGSSASEAVERTIIDLCRCINSSTTNTTTWAFYVSDPDGLPGKIQLLSRIHGTTFTVAASAHSNAYRPQLSLTSTVDAFTNGLAFSKPAQPDAVPEVNVIFLGRDDTALLRMQVLGDSIFLFTDCGIYRLTGRTFEDFQVQEFDLTFRLLGRELVATCDDAIYAWGYEGIARITNAGVEIISNAIEPRLQSALNTLGVSWMSAYGWAASYRSRHKVLFGIPETNAVANCSTCLVYDTRMRAWTRWVFTAGNDVNRTTGHSCGATRVSDDLLFLGQWNATNGDSSIFKERLTYAQADYQDDTYDTTAQPISKILEWNPMCAAPQSPTHWHQLHLFYDLPVTFPVLTTPTAVLVQYQSDRSSNSSNVAVAPTATDRMSRVGIPTAQRRSVRQRVKVTHAVVSEYFGLNGVAIVHRPPEGYAGTKT